MNFNLLLKIIKPSSLLINLIFYALGAGAADYLGASIDWSFYINGQIILLLFHLCFQVIKSYFDISDPQNGIQVLRNLLPDKEISKEDYARIKQLVLMLAFAVIFTAGIVLAWVLLNTYINGQLLIIFTIIILFIVFYAIPPFRLSNKGYGELILSFYMANIVPFSAFLFQMPTLHRIVPIITFPLTLISIVRFLALSLETYAGDLKLGRKPLMLRLNWNRGMNIHNILLLLAYLIMATFTFLSVPWILIWPFMLTIPVGIFQIFQIQQISRGAKPNWKLLTFTSNALMVFAAYFVAYSLWIR